MLFLLVTSVKGINFWNIFIKLFFRRRKVHYRWSYSVRRKLELKIILSFIYFSFLTGMVDKRTLEKYEKESKELNRESWYLSWALDTSNEERAKVIKYIIK